MRMYDFAIEGRNDLPRAKLQADNDDHFFQTVLLAWEKETRHRHVKGDVMCIISELMRVPEPPAKEKATDPATRWRYTCDGAGRYLGHRR